jgi:hypothetical protein
MALTLIVVQVNGFLGDAILLPSDLERSTQSRPRSGSFPIRIAQNHLACDRRYSNNGSL